MKYIKLSTGWLVSSALSLTFLAGCAGSSGQQPNGPNEPRHHDQIQTHTHPSLPGTTQHAYETLPNYRLDGAGFYRLLVSELALLNDAPDVALFLLGEAHEQYPKDPRILARLAPLAAQMGELDLALRYFQSWTEASPTNADAWHGVWQLAFVAGDIDVALSALESLLAQAPGYGVYIPFNLLMDWDQLKLQQFYDGITESELAASGSPDIQLMQGYIAELLNRPEAAAEHWQTLANTLETTNDYFSLGQILTDLEASAGARIVLAQASLDHPQEPRFYLLLARAHLQSENDAEALRVLQDGLEENPDDTGLLRFAGELAFEQDDYPLAEAYFTRLQGTPEADAGHYYRGRLAERRAQYNEAFEHYQNVIGDEWVLSATQRALPLIRNQLTDVDLQRYIEDQLQRFPSLQAELSELHGYHYYDNQDYERAFAAFSVGLRADPNNVALLYMRALSAEPLDQLEDLESDLRQILQRDPDNTAALNALGYTLIDRTDRIAEAAPMIEQAYTQSPDSYAITDSLGWLRFKQGEYDAAVDLLGQALEMQGWDSGDDEVVTHYVEALWMNEQQEEALATAERWLDQHQNSAKLRSLLDRLQESD